MGMFKRISTKKSCTVIIGVDVARLSKAMIDQAESDSMIFYQVIHDLTVNEPLMRGIPPLFHVYMDITDSNSVGQLFKIIKKMGHQPALIIFKPEPIESISTLDLVPSLIEGLWKVTGYSAFLVAQNAIAEMKPYKQGTFLFLGSDLATQPKSPWVAASAMQAGIRALSQSLAREFNPKGIHIAYLALENTQNDVQEKFDVIATMCWHAHNQSKYAWTQEFSLF